ncbi:hypothetical protein PAL_GLEAN10023211 [Pteropus alecto]|uniref:Uncharacterized protein n=1 Tax=Pteropus alecto TaxID=9402 RepID=L5K2E1_PTEAL|nr:hypothetical protein PAL_GLEAN10023211 [Pteropus alecto]
MRELLLRRLLWGQSQVLRTTVHPLSEGPRSQAHTEDDEMSDTANRCHHNKLQVMSKPSFRCHHRLLCTAGGSLRPTRDRGRKMKQQSMSCLEGSGARGQEGVCLLGPRGKLARCRVVAPAVPASSPGARQLHSASSAEKPGALRSLAYLLARLFRGRGGARTLRLWGAAGPARSGKPRRAFLIGPSGRIRRPRSKWRGTQASPLRPCADLAPLPYPRLPAERRSLRQLVSAATRPRGRSESQTAGKSLLFDSIS